MEVIFWVVFILWNLALLGFALGGYAALKFFRKFTYHAKTMELNNFMNEWDSAGRIFWLSQNKK